MLVAFGVRLGVHNGGSAQTPAKPSPEAVVINESDVNNILDFGLKGTSFGMCAVEKMMNAYLKAEGYVPLGGGNAPWATSSKSKDTLFEGKVDHAQIFIKRDRSWYFIQVSSVQDMWCIRHWGEQWFNYDSEVTVEAPNTPDMPERKATPDEGLEPEVEEPKVDTDDAMNDAKLDI